MPKPVQESFGEAIIDALRSFATRDIDDVGMLETKYLSHISDPSFRRTLAETWYGARWIYKLGLALLVKDEEQMAHVRAQLIDYCSVCEGVLSDMILHGIRNGHVKGKKHKYKDAVNLARPINWTTPFPKTVIQEQSFFWLISVAAEEKIIDSKMRTSPSAATLDRETLTVRRLQETPHETNEAYSHLVKGQRGVREGSV